MGEVANCPRCNAIFLKGTATVCPECRKNEEQEFQKVYTFVRKKKNRTATVADIEAHTGVSENRIRTFVKQKRLHPAQFPGLTYDCEKCGAQIREDRLCSSCTEEITKGIEVHERNETIIERRKEEERKRGMTYYSVNKNSH